MVARATAMSSLTSRACVGHKVTCSTIVRAGIAAQNNMAFVTSIGCIMVARACASGGNGRLSRMGVSTSAAQKLARECVRKNYKDC